MDPLQELRDAIARSYETDPDPDPWEAPAPAPPLSAPKRRRSRPKVRKRPADAAIMTAEQIADALGISLRQVQKLEKAGAFPIPRLPQVSRKPTYSRELVMRYARGELKLRPSNGKGGKTR